MPCLWLCLSLLFTATFRQSGAASDPKFSLNCNETVEVVAGNTVTLNCTIKSSTTENCKGLNYIWNNTPGNNPCNSDLNDCEWDNVTYVSLTISNVTHEENYTVKIHTDCGTAKSSIIVQVIPNGGPIDLPTYGTASYMTTAYVTAIFVTLIVLAVWN